MSERQFFEGLLVGWFFLAGTTFMLLSTIPAPYGRHIRRGWGPTVPSAWGWVLMESPAALVYAGCWAVSGHSLAIVGLVFLALWEAHYLHRSFIYPRSRRGGNAKMPLAIVGAGFLFNAGNAYLNGRYLYAFAAEYAVRWLGDARFLAGLALFLAGFVINRQSDYILQHLRTKDETVYRIPQDGFYRWVSCPNYLGEITEWVGWALATWSLAGLAFAIWTAANLVPRAAMHHRWYREHFPDYPPKRKALLPGIW